MVTPEKKFRLYTLFFCGLLFLFVAAKELGKLWMPEDSLTRLSGTLQESEIGITEYRSSGRIFSRGPRYDLITVFELNEFKKRFSFTIKQGNQPNERQLHSLKSQLHAADSIHIWLRKKEMTRYEPEIYRLDFDHRTILDQRNPDTSREMEILLLLLVGISLTLVTGFILWPDWIRPKGVMTSQQHKDKHGENHHLGE